MIREKLVAGCTLVSAVILVAVSAPKAGGNSSDAYWSGDFAKTDLLANARALQVYDGKLFVAADFTFPLDPLMRDIGTWDGTAWGNLGGGTNGVMNAMTVYNGELIVAGSFSQVGGVPAANIARWNGTSWQSLGSGTSRAVTALTVWNGLLVVGTRNSCCVLVTTWDGSTWADIGQWFGTGVDALTSYNSQLVALGYLGPTGPYVKSWGGAAWVDLGSMTTLSGCIPGKLCVLGSDLYLGATVPSGSSAYCLWKFNGSNWIGIASSTVLAGTPAQGIRFLAADASAIVFGGNLKIDGLPNDSNLFSYNGTTITSLHSESPFSLAAYARYNGQDFVGGTNGIQHWATNQWADEFWAHPLQFGMNGAVNDLLVWNDLLVAGGDFTFSGSAHSNRIAAWNDTAWAGLGSGMNARVNCLTEMQGELYAGGAFTLADGVSARHIARWGGSTWHPLDTGLAQAPSLLATYQNELIAYSLYGPIVGWNGTSWRVIADSIIGDVLALEPYNGMLYAGGLFTQIETVNASRIAAWDGSVWTPLQSGIIGNVYSLQPHGGQLHVGGSFGQAGAVCANRLAAWDGSNWSAGTTGLNEAIGSLGAYGSEVIVSGPFTLAGGDSANRIAQWNGTAMSAMGSGIDQPFKAAAEYHGALYLGGSFTKAGGKTSSYIAKWTGPAANNRRYSANQLAVLAITDTCALDCCHGNVGNVDCDPQNGIDISDLTRIIDYLYITFAPLCCPSSSNVDGSLEGNIDIADLTALIDFLYISFTAPLPCP